ncbi:MAG: AAA family ATPase [Proteobacteria bacterium]|nr:AAA family ATPase [Pseudomonadota bacterium]
MEFKRIRLSGFKSFVDPTELIIEPGLTGIVGPNGCGKSNLLEAMRWVMGETSAKRLRGEMMDDVIFSGTERRPSRNLAEVTLLLDNSDRKAPAQFNDSDELEVSRRIERDSGSAYRINGVEVRARDVQMLFADAATGANSPSLVSQGQVSAFVNAKPQERRLILEEAAGISGLHSRRKEAETRLRAAEGNLQRLGDIMIQMEAQAGSLKRQARQATRYKNIAGDIRRTQAILLHLKWQNLDRTVATAKEKLDQAERKVASQTATVARLNTISEGLHTGLSPLRQKEAEAGAALSRVRIEFESLEAEEKNVQNRITELKARLEQLDQDLARENTLLESSQETLTRQKGEQEDLRQELEADQQGAKGIESAYHQVLEKTGEEEARYNDLNTAYTGKKIRKDHLVEELQALAARKERLTTEREAAWEELSAIAPAGKEAVFDRTGVEAALKNLKEIEAGIEKKEGERLAAREHYDAAREALSGVRAGLSALTGEIGALESLLAEDTGGGVTSIAASIKVEAGYEAALSAALGDDLDALEGHVGPFHWRTLVDLKNPPALPEGARPLTDVVTAPAALKRRLCQVGIVEDGAGLMAGLHPGQRLVSKDGTLWRWDGLVRTSKAPAKAALKLLQQNKLEALKKKESPARDAMDKLAKDLGDKEQTLNQLTHELEALRARQQEASDRYSGEREKISDGESKGLKMAERSAALKEILARLDSDQTEARDKAIALETEIKTLAEEAGLEQDLNRARETLEDWREKLASARAKFETWRQVKDEKEARLGSLSREAEAWQERAAAARAQIEELDGRKQQAIDALSGLDRSPDRFEEKRKALLDLMAKAESAAAGARDKLAEAENRTTEKDRELKAAGAVLSGIREDMVRHQSHHESTGERLEELQSLIHEEFGCTAGSLVEEAEIKEKQLEKFSTTEAAEIKLERLKVERERLGAVNLRADVELEELESEVERLTREKEDLEGAIRGLRASIGSLNREGRQKMLEAFEIVNKNFGELFSKIFNGGHGHLVLTEADDPLEAGLDIMASPPGKKLLHRSLLSGGEQALTAITLIFAVFLTNPAPVCVLDEVDAPLDDANIERFCDLLDEIKERTETRFLIVTHNAISMARMERLYGVTMSEQGVSQLVSVDLENTEEMRAFA